MLKNNRKLIMMGLVALFSIGGYVLAFFQFKSNSSLEKKLLKGDMDRIGVIDDDLSSIRKDKNITLDELIKSREKIQKLIDTAKRRDTSVLKLEEALKIIKEL
jgi:hypothetical protein